jgi:hypothetical protein
VELESRAPRNCGLIIRTCNGSLRLGCRSDGYDSAFARSNASLNAASLLQKGGQFAIHAQALPGNPYDGHTLARIISAIEQLLGNAIKRLHADAGYRGQNAPSDCRFKVYTSKQKRRLTPQIEREMRRRSAIELVIGHLKNEHRMDRNYLHHRHGDANNAILAAVGSTSDSSSGG